MVFFHGGYPLGPSKRTIMLHRRGSVDSSVDVDLWQREKQFSRRDAVSPKVNRFCARFRNLNLNTKSRGTAEIPPRFA